MAPSPSLVASPSDSECASELCVCLYKIAHPRSQDIKQPFDHPLRQQRHKRVVHRLTTERNETRNTNTLFYEILGYLTRQRRQKAIHRPPRPLPVSAVDTAAASVWQGKRAHRRTKKRSSQPEERRKTKRICFAYHASINPNLL